MLSYSQLRTHPPFMCIFQSHFNHHRHFAWLPGGEKETTRIDTGISGKRRVGGRIFLTNSGPTSHLDSQSTCRRCIVLQIQDKHIATQHTYPSFTYFNSFQLHAACLRVCGHFMLFFSVSFSHIPSFCFALLFFFMGAVAVITFLRRASGSGVCALCVRVGEMGVVSPPAPVTSES